MSRLRWLKLILLRYYRNMGLRVLLYAVLSVGAALLSPVVSPYVDSRLGFGIDFSSVLPVLTILASSMLAVSTFSLNIMVTAHRAAADVATPRMHRILLDDTTTQSVLAAFIGAFVYSLSTIVLYRLGFYAEDAAVLVMGLTVLVVIVVVISLLRWIDHLTTLGSLENSLWTARQRARDTLRANALTPRFGAMQLSGKTVLPVTTTPLRAPCSGFVQLIDMAALNDHLPPRCALYLDIRPGSHVLKDTVIGQVSGSVDDALLDHLADAFTIGDDRTHEQDAEFGLVVLSEIACKALSPGINDSGTAIQSIQALKSVLWDYDAYLEESELPNVPQVFAAFPGPETLIEAAFDPIARDSADRIEVALTLRRALAALTHAKDPGISKAAHEMAAAALGRAKDAGLNDRDLDRLASVDLVAQT